MSVHRLPPTLTLPHKGGGKRGAEIFTLPLDGGGKGGGVTSPLYAELQVTTNFSFLRGASDPQELVGQAIALGLRAIAITDRNSLAGVVRAHSAVKELKKEIGDLDFKLIIGARLDLDDGPSLLCFPRGRPAYSRLTTLLTIGKRRAEKGQCRLSLADVFAQAEGQILVVLPPETLDESFRGQVAAIRDRVPTLYIAAQALYRGDDERRIHDLGALADALSLGVVATNDVHYHDPSRRLLQDVLTCIREGCTIHEAGYRLAANAERHLKSPAEMARLFATRPDALRNTLAIADACTFSLEELQYEYPAEPVPEGRTPQEELERLTWEGAAWRYPGGIPEKVRGLLANELALIAELRYAPYFLTVHDIMRFAREQKILCQGRGSAANSTVCFALRITEVDPDKHDLLFARFVSTERQEPPDIDVDFEHERREEVIQYIYGKYGRDRAGLAATVISYRARSALRDVGKAMGLSLDAVDALSRAASGWDRWDESDARYVREVGLDPDDPTIRLILKLTNELIGFPRHLSQHVGGFVITRSKLHELVPIENAAMEERTVIEWDKDDLDEVGMFKIDILALGMLSCLRRGLALLKQHHGVDHTLASIPQDDKPAYEMMCRADTIGVFQIESRAQMSMLPRLQPREFYDLVIEVAIVRPGPIQGGMVHPYLQRREAMRKYGTEPTYPSPELRGVLEKTLGVPLFQEQAMKIAIVAAGFTPERADKLRRAMATFRRSGTIPKFREEFIAGMMAKRYDRDFAERCFQQIEGFADYGFPESHSASFAILVYVSAWMKCHYPAAFAAALLNSQPMGFYAPAQIVRDAREHQVEVRPVDVNHSDWDCTLEPAVNGAPALRLGFRQIKGFREAEAKALIEKRGAGYATLREAWQRASLTAAALEALANADACGSIGLDRRAALWQIRALGETPLPLFSYAERANAEGAGSAASVIGHNSRPTELIQEPPVVLPAMPLGEQVVEDYRHLTFTLKKHPMALLRHRFVRDGTVQHAQLSHLAKDAEVTVTGLVLVRQQPGTSKGVIFLTMEDETGIANVIVWQRVYQRFRRTLLDARLLQVRGRLQREGLVIHIVADTLVDRTDELRLLSQEDGRFEQAMSRADQVRRPGRDVRDVMPAGRNFH